jgi:methylisocitrate lyase
MNLEDQVFPKRCGRVAGKELVSLDEMVARIQTASAARSDADFVINARTDALGLFGIDEVVRRGNAYLQAGATMIFVQGVSSRSEIASLTDRIRGPVGINLIEQNPSCADISFTEMQELGVARVSLSASTMLAAMHGIRKALRKVREWDGTRLDAEVFVPFADLHALAGMDEALAIEKRFSVPSQANEQIAGIQLETKT